MKIGVIGHFGIGHNLLNGQTIKTKNFADGIEKYTNFEVIKIDSNGWIKRPFNLFNKIRIAFKECEAIVMLPAQNGVKIFAPLLWLYKKIYHKKIFYNVIGGWLPDFIQNKKLVLNSLKHFDGIWVETSTMKNKLEELNFKNIAVIPNFKDLKCLSETELIYQEFYPLKLCTFSRVMKEKGIETAVNIIKNVNDKLGYIAYSLDIYGQIDTTQEEWFDELKNNFPSYVQYCGYVQSDKSVEVLKYYFALLFPTHFYTEGIPGTIVDAYVAGVPIISSKWESYSDVVDEGITGIGYSFYDVNELEHILLQIVDTPNIISNFKKNCLKKSKTYSTENAIDIISQQFK